MKYSNRMKTIILYFLLIMVLNIVLVSYKVEAATFLVTASKEEVTVGDTFTVTINGTGLTGKYSITGSSNISITGDTTPWIENTSVTITCTAKEAGKATLTVTPETVADANTGEDQNLGAKSVSVNVKAPATTAPEQPTTPPATQPTTPTKSSEARLKNFGIKPNDFSGFKKDKTEYSTEVPNSVTEVEVYADPVDSKATVTGKGKVSLKEGNNTVKVKVTAEDGKTTKTYTLTIKRQTEAETETTNGEARLSELGIKPEQYDFSGFKSDQTEYSVEVPNDVKEIEVYAKAMDSKAQIAGTGMITLKEGKNELKVEVIAQNGTKKTYTINVTRKEAEETTTIKKFGLSTLSIDGLKLTPNFITGTYEYTVELTENISSLEIDAKATDKNATIEIIGNENLQQGENIITILVQNKDTEETATYQIIVNKKLQEEIVQTSWLKPSTWGKEEKIKIAIIVVLIILIISAIILKISIAKENKLKNKLDLPGADELDKAITEHQELTEEVVFDKEEITQSDVQQNNIEEITKKEIQQNNIEDITQNEVQQNSIDKTTKNESKQNYIEDIAKNRFGVEDFEERTNKKRKGKH